MLCSCFVNLGRLIYLVKPDNHGVKYSQTQSNETPFGSIYAYCHNTHALSFT